MASALVIGGTGFLGSNLALRLVERRWRVRILARPGTNLQLLEEGPFEITEGDILQPDTLPHAMQGIDVVFNSAGVVDYWNQGEERMYAVNVDGTRNVMQAALDCGIRRVVHTSSTAAMGIHPNSLVDESYEFNVKPDRFVYGHSKYLAERVVFEYIQRGLPAIIVNPTTVIGPRDVRKVSSGVVVEVVNHCIPPLIPPGGLNVIPICDVGQAHIEAALKGKVGERYILAGQNMTHQQLYQTIANVVGCGKRLSVMPRWQVGLIAGLTDMLQPPSRGPVPLTGQRLRLEAKTFYYDGSKARETFTMPATPLSVTIGRTYEWYEEHGEFEGMNDNLDRNGVCKVCGKARFCKWPNPSSPLAETEHAKAGES
jgi:dihydroflavonol-4-reductase